MLQGSLADALAWADPALVPWFDLLGAPVTPLELVAFILSLWMVACNLRVHVWGWPLAIASSLLYGVFFARGKLYGEACLQLVFVALSVWGWAQWLKKPADDAAGAGVVRYLGQRQRWLWLVVALGLWPIMGGVLQRYTDTDVAFADALPTTFSLLGQYLLGRKYVENWAVWLLVNVVSMALFAYKGFWLTVVLYGIFALLSALGWRQWRQMVKS